MNLYKILSFILLFLFAACEKPDEPITATSEVPKLISTIPANMATISPTTRKIVCIFDRNIILVDKAKIKINETTAPSAKASIDSLIIESLSLDEKTEYTLILGKNSIKALSGKLNPEPFSITFTTNEFPLVEVVPLATPNPSPEAVKLYHFLKENYGKKIISGAVANVNWNTNEAGWVYKHTGKYPALNAFDYIHLYASPANWIDYGNTQIVEDWWNNNGIVAAMWHWNVPVNQGSNNYEFYTGKTSFDISQAVREGTYENSVIKADLEKIANYLLLLKQKNIPVVWRPLHEAAGGWFWWGAKGAQPCKELWIIMFDFFREKGLNNLIWVWTAEPGDDAWYPGDEYVDIIGRDMYNKPEANGMANEYQTLKNRFPNKIIALSECGNVAGIPAQWNAEATWSWFMPWYDYDRTKDLSGETFNSEAHQHASIAFWKNAFADDRVISRDEMPSLKNNP